MNAQLSRSVFVQSLCSRCLYDSGFQCGMAGAARCSLLEMWEHGLQPQEWSRRSAGSWTCSAFEGALVSFEH